MSSLQKLREYSAELFDLGCVQKLLQWDQEVNLPELAAEGRSYQLAEMAAIVHHKETAKELGELLKSAEAELSDAPKDEQRALVRVMKRNYELSTKLPLEFVTEFTKTTSQAMSVWVQARRENNFKLFLPYLEKVVELNKRQAEYFGYEAHPLNALLDIYEEGLTVEIVSKVFGEIRDPLVSILHEVKDHWKEDFDFTNALEVPEQIAFAKKTLEIIGFDFKRGRLDTAPHPFMDAFGHDDRRVTSRYHPYQLEFIFSSMHEGGHAMYEQGIADSLSRSALDGGVSLGIHESQSRFWENIVGRSYEFWQYYYPQLQEAFPLQFREMSLDDFYLRINRVHPGFIRVDADEVTYNLHILIRFELEKAMIEGTLKPSDAPEAWNAKYKEYLGLDVASDADGVLQDIHWSHGTLGYFPTYTLGNLLAAQLWKTYQKQNPEYKETVRKGELQTIHGWFKEQIYQYGSIYQPQELIKRVTGEELSSKYLIEYLREKYTK